MKLVDKDTLVAEIEKWTALLTKEKNQEGASKIDKLSLGGRIAELQEVKSFLDTLEVKDIDLGGEVESYWKQCDSTWCRDAYTVSHIRIMLSDIAKCFFELGLKAQKGE